MAPSNILIWNEGTGFVRICEGRNRDVVFVSSKTTKTRGSIDVEFLKYNGNSFDVVYSAVPEISKPYQSKFKNEKDVVKHLIDYDWIPDVNYIYLYVK